MKVDAGNGWVKPTRKLEALLNGIEDSLRRKPGTEETNGQLYKRLLFHVEQRPRSAPK